MASKQLTGAQIMVIAKSPAGDEKRLFSGVNEQTGPGGSPDGAQSTVKANELPVMKLNPFRLKGGDRIIIKGIMKSADGADASDSVFNLPIVRNGRQEYLSRDDLGYDTDLPANSPADVEHQLGVGYTVPQGDIIMIGGGTYFLSWEDDTA